MHSLVLAVASSSRHSPRRHRNSRSYRTKPMCKLHHVMAPNADSCTSWRLRSVELGAGGWLPTGRCRRGQLCVVFCERRVDRALLVHDVQAQTDLRQNSACHARCGGSSGGTRRSGRSIGRLHCVAAALCTGHTSISLDTLDNAWAHEVATPRSSLADNIGSIDEGGAARTMRCAALCPDTECHRHIHSCCRDAAAGGKRVTSYASGPVTLGGERTSRPLVRDGRAAAGLGQLSAPLLLEARADDVNVERPRVVETSSKGGGETSNKSGSAAAAAEVGATPVGTLATAAGPGGWVPRVPALPTPLKLQ